MCQIFRAQPDKLRGRQLLIGAIVWICQGRKDEGKAGYEAHMGKNSRQRVTRHMAMWAQQSMTQREQWEHRARRHAAARHHLISI